MVHNFILLLQLSLLHFSHFHSVAHVSDLKYSSNNSYKLVKLFLISTLIVQNGSKL